MQQAHTGSSAEEKSFTSISSIYGKNSGVEIKTCAALQEMISVRIPPQNDQWWCILVCTIEWHDDLAFEKCRARKWNWKYIIDGWRIILLTFFSIVQEFSCQEVRDCSDDMVIFFATNSDMRRFLSILETVWHTKNVRRLLFFTIFLKKLHLLTKLNFFATIKFEWFYETNFFCLQNSPFPQSILSENDTITSHGSNLFSSLNRAWEPLLASALGYPH